MSSIITSLEFLLIHRYLQNMLKAEQLTGQQGKGGDHLIPLYHFHQLTNASSNKIRKYFFVSIVDSIGVSKNTTSLNNLQ